MEDALVSIIIPTYNIEKYIRETIECVLAQTYQNWELEITDDCSTDNTVNIIKQYAEKDSRIHLWQLEKNSGAGNARNNSIKKARGRYIAFLDSDDWWFPDKLEKQIAFMKKNNYEFTFTYTAYTDENLNITAVYHKPKQVSKTMIRIGNVIGTASVIYDTHRIGKVYMPNMRKSEDWGLWIRIIEKTNNAYSLNIPLLKYRVIPNSLSKNKIDMIRANLNVYHNILGYSRFTSLLMFIFCFTPYFIWYKWYYKHGYEK